MKLNFYAGGAIAMWLLVIMVIAAELFEPFKTALASVFTHHWIGKLVLVIIAFILFSFLFKDKKSIMNIPYEKLAWKSAIGSLALIFLFYVFEFFV